MHTPGPWERPTVASNKVFADGVEICRANRVANARLIAAAPDLLQALQAIADKLRDPTDGHYQYGPSEYFEQLEVIARAAIAKAIGQS